MGRYAYSSPEWERQHSLPPVYAFDVEDENEITRLLLQHRYLSECMGGILPTSLDLSQVKRALDAGCGAGGWVYELAWQYPSVKVLGIDQRSDLVAKAEEFVSNYIASIGVLLLAQLCSSGLSRGLVGYRYL